MKKIEVNMMELQEYLEKTFWDELHLLPVRSPNRLIKENSSSFKIDANTVYFGGRNWEHFDSDLARMNAQHRIQFIMCLFTMVSLDLTTFAYFNSNYESFRSKYPLPKFGWSGFGPHYEEPWKLLECPEAANVLSIRDAEKLRFNQFFYSTVLSVCESTQIAVSPGLFLKRMTEGRDFQSTSGKSEVFDGLLAFLTSVREVKE